MTDRPAPRWGVLRDGLLLGGLCAAFLVARVRYDAWIGPSWVADLARDLGRPALAMLTLGCLALWAVMAVRGAENGYQRWTARFVFGWFLVGSALLYRLTRYPIYTLVVIAVVIWATYGMGAAMIERYLFGRMWWPVRLAILAAFLAVFGMLVWGSVR